MLELNSHEFDEGLDEDLGERVREIVVEDEGEMIREERQRSKERKIEPILLLLLCY